MKKIILLITLLILAGFTVGASAQETELPDPGLTPDSPFYFLETIAEGIGTFFTFGDLKKAERYATLAAERLAEAKAVVEKGKPEFAEKTLARYENQLNNSIARAKKAMVKAKSAEKVLEVITKVGKATSVHLGILAEVYEKVPEQAKPAIERAMTALVKGHEKAVEALKAKDALGEIPEGASLPAEIPEEVRERIQRKAQIQRKVQEELEKVLQDFESLRAFCIEKGGPSEMCEKIPLRGFKSFKALEDFCVGEGGPPEICTSLEAKCKELGIRTADECFLALSTVTVEAAPAPEMEKAREELRIQREAEEALRREAEEEFSSGQLEVLAKCLTEKGVKFYGSENCGYCTKQKEMFGDAASFLPYIECTAEETRHFCEEAEIGAVPAWDFPGKERMLGLQSFEQLIELSGCFLQ